MGSTKKSGYTYLRIKISKQEQTIKDLEEQVVNLTSDISDLIGDRDRWKNKAQVLEKKFNLAVQRMGWLRRKLFRY